MCKSGPVLSRNPKTRSNGSITTTVWRIQHFSFWETKSACFRSSYTPSSKQSYHNDKINSVSLPEEDSICHKWKVQRMAENEQRRSFQRAGSWADPCLRLYSYQSNPLVQWMAFLYKGLAFLLTYFLYDSFLADCRLCSARDILARWSLGQHEW